MSRIPTLLILIALLLVFSNSAYAESPFTLEDIFTPPYPFGTSAASISISDDGAYLACGWDAEAESIRDLWIYNIENGVWTQRTDLWPDREARLRREFNRELAQERADWEEQQEEA